MNNDCYAVIVLSKCAKSHKTYGMRAEKRDSQWFITWAFPINETSAKREGYDKTSIRGNIIFTNEYPGCPYCKGNAITVCRCGHLNCTVFEKEISTCQWCGKQGKLGEYTGEAIIAGIDA